MRIGEKVSRNLIRKFNSWNLNKKIYVFVTSLIYGISIITITFFTSFYIATFIEQSNNIAKTQLSTMATNYEYTLESYKELAESMIIDESIQKYLKSEGPDDPNYFSLVRNLNGSLQSTFDSHSSIRVIAIDSYTFDGVVYKGNINMTLSSFANAFRRDYENSILSRNPGTLRMSVNDMFQIKDKNILSVYMPIYSVTKMINEVGLLCIVFDNSIFEGLSTKSSFNFDSEMMLVDTSNTIVSCTNGESIGKKFDYSDMLKGSNGDFTVISNIYNYQKIGNWNYYIVSRIPLMNMYRDSLVMIAFLIVISVAIAYFGMIICKKILNRTYKPLDRIVKAMNCAAEGNLDVRINAENVGIDFVHLGNGFNYMMGQINELIEQVKLEQQQMDQIKFNALQAQIQPHFLYNTLECIHWQASADGNEDISDFVKVLAQYYRLCLSKGKDVITLEQEIEHVRNYLYIQNIRYDNIIEFSMEIAEDCKSIPIPKITLQPLVENSIYHGIKVREGKTGRINIKASKREEDVYIEISDNGTGMSESQIEKMNCSISEYDKDFGYGIRNVNKRIELMFGKEYGLHYQQNSWGGVTVIIHLPSNQVQRYEEVL